MRSALIAVYSFAFFYAEADIVLAILTFILILPPLFLLGFGMLLRKIGITLLLLAHIRIMVADVRTVRNISMLPELSPGDIVLISKFAYGVQLPRILGSCFFPLRKPATGDIVVFADPESPATRLIKRVQEVSGSGVRVLGDNSSSSRDSRTFGLIPVEDIRGKVFYTLKPAGSR